MIIPLAAPLDKFTNQTQPFATAFVLSLNKTNTSYGNIQLDITHDEINTSKCINSSLNTLHESNPIADSLPLLEALMLKNNSTIYLPHLNNSKLKVDVGQ